MKVEDRKQLLAMAQRRAKAGSGSAPEAIRENRASYGQTVEFPNLQGLRHAIVGGLATALYMPQRMTLDTDVLISADDLRQAESILEGAGYERTGSLTIGGSTWSWMGGRSLDLIALDRPWLDEALSSVVYDDAQRPFVALPYLVLMKLESGRLQDLADISRMLGCAERNQIDATRAVIGRFRPQDIEDLESMVRLGKLEHD